VKLDRKEDNGEQSGIRHEGIVHSDQSTDEAGTTTVILKLVACLPLERHAFLHLRQLSYFFEFYESCVKYLRW
jgi:hypothetical protein